MIDIMYLLRVEGTLQVSTVKPVRYLSKNRGILNISILCLFLGLLLNGCRSGKITDLGKETVGPKAITVTFSDTLAEQIGELPIWLKAVTPLPGEVLPVDTYSSFANDDTPELDLPRRDLGYDSTVCAIISIDLLIQPGDALVDRNTVANRFAVEVDGNTLPRTIRGYSEQSLGIVRNAQGTPVGSYSGPSQAFCWHADLAAGYHQVTIAYRVRDGETKQYQWSFELTE